MAKEKRSLSGDRRIDLYEWLKAIATQERVTSEKHTIEGIAKLASNALGFPVGRSSVEPIMVRLGVRTPRAHKGSQSIEARIEALEKKMAELCESLGQTFTKG